MTEFKLADNDRARISALAGKNVPEWIDFDALSITTREAIILAKAGWRTPFLWRIALSPGDEDDEMLTKTLHVTVDGVLGPETVSAAHEAGPAVALTFLKARAGIYRDIGRDDPSQAAFPAGWITRLLDQAWRRA